VHSSTKDKCDDEGSFYQETFTQFPKYYMKILFGDFKDGEERYFQTNNWE
jgi:hypothetical protein